MSVYASFFLLAWRYFFPSTKKIVIFSACGLLIWVFTRMILFFRFFFLESPKFPSKMKAVFIQKRLHLGIIKRHGEIVMKIKCFVMFSVSISCVDLSMLHFLKSSCFITSFWVIDIRVYALTSIKKILCSHRVFPDKIETFGHYS